MSESVTGNSSISEPLLRKNKLGQIILSRSRDVRFVLELALEEATRMVKAQYGNFYFYNEKGDLEAYRSFPDESESQAICAYCIENHTSLNVNTEGELVSISEASTPRKPFVFRVSAPTICVNLGLQEGEFGAIIIRGPMYSSQFFEMDLGLIKTFAATFSILLRNGWRNRDTSEIFLNFKSSLLLLLENANLIQKVKHSDQTLRTVLEVSNLINSTRVIKDMVQAVLYSARKVINAESASLFLVDEKTGDLYFDIISGTDFDLLGGMRIPAGQGIVGICARDKKSIIVNDAQNDPRLYKKVDEVAQIITRNLVAVPLIVDGKVIGVLEVINTVDRPSFSQHDLELFESFSDSVAIALQRRIIQAALAESNTKLEQRLSEITCLHAVAAALVDAKSIDEIFSRVLKIIRESLGAGRVSVLLHNVETDKLELTASAKEADMADPAYDEDEEGLSYYAFNKNEPLFLRGEELKEYSEYLKPDRYKTEACILIPMSSLSENRPLGVLCVTEARSGELREEDFNILINISSQLVRGYENIKLTEEFVAKKAMEKEVEITSKIQQNILPSGKPEHRNLELAYRSVMARTTGGDFYDYYIHKKDGEVTLLVADVSGKSLPAALFMAISSSILRTIIRTESDPSRILALSNELLFEESQSGMFVTVFLARFEPMTGRLRYASAGHNEMILMHKNGEYEMLSGKGPPLGVIPGRPSYNGGILQLSEEDLLVLYTDGVVEAIDPVGEEFGLDRFLDILKLKKNETPEHVIQTVYDDVIEFSESELQYDDFTMLLSRFSGLSEKVGLYHIIMPANVDSIPALRDFMMAICEIHGVEGNLLEDILLATDEAATNIVLHAYQGTRMSYPDYECDLEILTGNKIRFTLTDRGNSFSMDEVKDPDLEANLTGERKGGFGVFLIRKLMDRVEYRHEDGTNYLTVERSLEKINSV